MLLWWLTNLIGAATRSYLDRPGFQQLKDKKTKELAKHTKDLSIGCSNSPFKPKAGAFTEKDVNRTTVPYVM
ncbi:hypothetical protein FRX31_006950 [Thalictrum thalictroides]|uniref:Uncharacterized protein n=1 Tax=Thalictrum thalictroides TaxID=46969 RepID=A0A7J6WEE4_THATH|nr:hypothetical protein FRX31_014599 [Thalictrum thalictroides]KAF5203463.1 hypothetical protein FRX31_006950 [Thalictrum thalictroides]